MRQLVLDTETTGLETKDGHRLIELGCVELINRRLTGNNLHLYFNPERKIDQEAIDVHGITNQFLEDKPTFPQKVAEIMAYLAGAELVIHNAAFDIGFLNYELSRLVANTYGKITDHCSVVDTLEMAREMHPGQRNSLDALCRRYEINNSHRTLHGALLDAEILASVYLAMTSGQELLFDFEESTHQEQSSLSLQAVEQKENLGSHLKVIPVDGEAEQAHLNYLSLLSKKRGESIVW